jgi:chitin synthase
MLSKMQFILINVCIIPGEDRWLCTLLLQRGYRVEYSAASDAYTHAPEGFNEFYNQRRRWVPSTMANIMDLLMDYKKTIKINDNISMPYIGYQMMLMGGTILGPGTIFLMLVGAFVAAFRIDNWTSFEYNIIPIAIFMLVCFTCKSDVQVCNNAFNSHFSNFCHFHQFKTAYILYVSLHNFTCII